MLGCLLLPMVVATSPPTSDLLVSVEWLATHRSDRNVVLLHIVHDKADYDKGHIPGARFLPAHSLWVTTGPGVELPPIARIDSLFESLGVSNDSRIVLYGDAWTTPRAFLALDYIGLGDQTALLNGGLTAWTGSGMATSAEAPATFAAGSITPRARPEIIVDADWLNARLDDRSLALVDARSPAEYAGTTESERLPRYGHIPGAKNLPWTETFSVPTAADSGRATVLIDTAKLTAMFEAAGAGGGKQIVTYCTVGLRASHMYFIARLLGHRPKIYDGSMRDWSPRSELPVIGPARQPAAPRPPQRRHLVDADWLHHNFDAVTILHADRTRASYDSAHIVGARFVPVSAFAVERNGLPTELPPAERLDSLLESLGVGDQGTILLYGDLLAATRLFFTLDYLGLADRVVMLDGGIAPWRAGGHPVTTEAPIISQANLTIAPRPEVVVDAAWITTHVGDRSVVAVDARKPEEYAGTVTEEGVDRPGHIPGSTNLEWTTLFTGGRLKSQAELEALFRVADVSAQKTMVAYCRVGTRATALYFAAKVAGYRVTLYDGSMVDWSRRAELPVATGPARGGSR